MSKPQIHINNKYDRIVVLIDMDCFYCQVEERINPDLKGKPIAVVQYNAWRGGGIIAVNYPARHKGVTRHMRGDEAKAACPDIELVKVPNIREKADLSKYRDAGKEVAEVLQSYTPLLERASVDEAYLDITERVQKRLMEMNEGKFQLKPETLQNTYAIGFNTIGEYVQDISTRIGKNIPDDHEFLIDVPPEDRKAYKKSDIKLLIGSSIVNEIRAAVKEKTGYDCSAGIAHNKVMAKLVCGMNKPNKQTILPLKYIEDMFRELPVRKVKGLGGKFGEELCEELKIEKMADLLQFSKAELVKRYDERNGQWLYLIVRGIDLEAVTPRFASKSIACCKKFPGRNAITGIATLNHWFKELSKEIRERLEKDEVEYNRKPRQLVVSFTQTINGSDVASSRSVPIANPMAFDEDKMAAEALDVLKKNTEKFFKNENCNVINNPIKFLGLSVGKFENHDNKKGNTIQDMFRKNFEGQAAAAAADKLVEEDGNTSNIEPGNEAAAENSDDQHLSKDPTEKAAEPETQADGKLKPGSFFSTFRKSPVSFPTENVNDTALSSTELNDDSQLSAIEVGTSTAEVNVSESAAPPVQPECNSVKRTPTFSEQMGQVKTSKRSVSPPPTTEPKPSTSNPLSTTAPDYTHSYAEFQRPANLHELEIPLITCAQCNKPVKITEMQTHTDAHLAYQLSQAQREEFRNHLKTAAKPSVVSPPSKRPKITTKTSAPAASTGTLSIDRFLVRKDVSSVGETSFQTADVPSGSEETSAIAQTEATETCSECNKDIPISCIVEHMDYHVAKKLQMELRREELNAGHAAKLNDNNNSLKQIKNTDVKKRKQSVGGAGKKQVSNVKSVASFFTK